MITRTIYVPANLFGRDILTNIWAHVSCSMGDIKRVDGHTLKVPITMPEREVMKVNQILQTYGLM